MVSPANVTENWKFQEIKHTKSCGTKQRTSFSKENQEKDEDWEQIVTNMKRLQKISENRKASCREIKVGEDDVNFGRV